MASTWSLVTYRNVLPSERWMRVSSVRISTRSLRSRLVSGSSIRNARGSRTSARPSATRCIWPPDICAGLRLSSSSMCSSSETRLTCASISDLGSLRARSGEAMFSAAVCFGYSA